MHLHTPTVVDTKLLKPLCGEQIPVVGDGKRIHHMAGENLSAPWVGVYVSSATRTTDHFRVIGLEIAREDDVDDVQPPQITGHFHSKITTSRNFKVAYV